MKGPLLPEAARCGEKPSRTGIFTGPTLVAGVEPESRLVTEEVFGPVLPVMTIPDLATAIREANNYPVWARGFDLDEGYRERQEVL